jgi:hypothetical protein
MLLLLLLLVTALDPKPYTVFIPAVGQDRVVFQPILPRGG